MTAARSRSAAAREQLTAAGCQSLTTLLLDAAPAGQLSGAATRVLKKIHHGTENIHRSSILHLPLVRLLNLQRLVKFGDQAGDVGVVGWCCDDENLIQTCVCDDLCRGLRSLRILLHQLPIDDYRLGAAAFLTTLIFATAAITGGTAANGVHALGFLFLSLRIQSGLNDLGHRGSVSIGDGNELGDQRGPCVADVQRVANGDELFHHRAAFRDQQAGRSQHGGDAPVNAETDVTGKHGGRILRVQMVELHEVTHDRLPLRQILRRGVELDAMGKLHRIGALIARGQNAGALAARLHDDGITIREQRGLNELHRLRFLHRFRRCKTDRGTVENVGVLDQGHTGEQLIDAEHVHDRIVRKLKDNFFPFHPNGL